MSKNLSIITSLIMASGIALGAFGAHGLKEIVTPERLQVYEKGVLYHLVHGLALLILSVSNINIPSKLRNRIYFLMLTSLLIFSGSLYILVITDTSWLGAITPIGGAGLIFSWIYLAFLLNRSNNQ